MKTRIIEKPIDGFLFFGNREASQRENNISYYYFTDWGKDLKTFDRWYGLKPEVDKKPNFNLCRILENEDIILKNKIIKIIVGLCDIDKDTITSFSSFKNVYGMDIIDIGHLLTIIESDYPFYFPNSFIDKVDTMQDIINYIQEYKNESI